MVAVATVSVLWMANAGEEIEEEEEGEEREKKNWCLCEHLLRLCRMGSSFLSSYCHHAREGLKGFEGCERAICALRMEAASKRYR